MRYGFLSTHGSLKTHDRAGTRFGALTLSLLLMLLAAPAHLWAADADDDGEEASWDIGWKDSFYFNSPDGDFKLKFGGRLNADFSFADADQDLEAALGPIEDASEFRRARLYVSGTIYKRVEFKVQYDFAGGDADLKDAYIGFKDTPIGDVKVGHFKEPFSLEELTSSNYITFLERGLNNVFAPSRNTGIQVSDGGDRYTWAVGAFRESDDFGFSEGDGKLNLTGRVTGLPVYADKGSRLVHLGLGLSSKDLGDARFRYRQRPEAHLSPRFVDTGSFDAERALLADLELAVVSGAFWATAEYTVADMDAGPLGDPSFDSYTVEAGWFLTGESRPYKKSSATFDRVKPKGIFGKDGGRGAWEIAGRVSSLDLGDAALDGGKLDDISLALNWYPNPASRVMLNWVHADQADLGEADFILLRLQVTF